MNFKVLFLDGCDLYNPQKEGDAGYDIPLYGDIELKPNSLTTVSTGIAVEIPPGYVGFVKGRSGLAFKENVFLKHEGVIDSNYRGEIKIILENANPFPKKLIHGTRIAQLVIVPVLVTPLNRVSELSESSRGTLGFGSSGLI